MLWPHCVLASHDELRNTSLSCIKPFQAYTLPFIHGGGGLIKGVFVVVLGYDKLSQVYTQL